MSLFTIVRFKNDGCNSSSGLNGTCYSSADCSNLGGSAFGSCASGFGVCCIGTVVECYCYVARSGGGKVVRVTAS